MISRGFLLLFWLFLVHLAGIYLFTGGFLLSRLSLTNISTCGERPCSLPPTHKRAVFLIIDALRFDFVSSDTPQPASPFHHNVLTLPHQLTKSQPRRSFLFNAYADPPTTTLQRIKGLTTGSLPTFVDLGNNFGASSIAEDSILKQLKLAGKKAAFMGDDTWMSVFPDAFERNMTFPFDSFNVEDLHTVDEGVISNIFPLLQGPHDAVDFIVGHFLGVDHVGHRVGPDHPSMRAKLTQMNDVLTRVVELLDDETLLVVLGDHGMDRTGDHGGDGDLETSSALWIYSKGRDLSKDMSSIPTSLLDYTTFPKATKPHRSVQQIDILPTLGLLLGLPIPFNNLGSVIPELFARGSSLVDALALNSAQIKSYLDAYRASASGSELDDSWPRLVGSFAESQVKAPKAVHLTALRDFNRLTLSTCRSLWAQFNPIRMSMGLALLGFGVIAAWAAYSKLSTVRHDWDAWLAKTLPVLAYAGIAGAGIGVAAHSLISTHDPSLTLLDYLIFTSASLSTISALILSLPSWTILRQMLPSSPVLLLIHSISFFSNSFTFWEDRIVPFLLISSIVPFALSGVTAPTSRLRKRILGFSLLFGICVRLMSMSSVCREEQQPYCSVTFFASSTLPAPPLLVRLLAVPTAIFIPFAMQKILHISKSDVGVAKVFLFSMLRTALLAASLAWLAEWADSAHVVERLGMKAEEYSQAFRTIRTTFGIGSFAGMFCLGSLLFWFVPMCLEIDDAKASSRKTQDPNSSAPKRQITVIGFGNAFGSPYLLFWSIYFCLVYATQQLTGQLVLALSATALLAYLEVVDSARDVRAFEQALLSSSPSQLLSALGGGPDAASSPMFGRTSPQVAFSDVVPIALLGVHAFFATGHQATISSIQWKTAFVLVAEVKYPWAPLTVVLNSFGPLFLTGVSAPLLALWNRSPLGPPAAGPESGTDKTTPQATQGPQQALAVPTDSQIRRESVMAGAGVMVYHGCLLLGAAASAALLRRHLMVWKVFAPRFMLAVCSLLAVDAGVLLGFGLGVERIALKVDGMFDGIGKKGNVRN
ncbi:hypothetical protein HGRIS_010842 [Hohenbuehelia grisea]|uniref:GPI ethanolamine phosphate transferase 2 C-terminal domain-containing protein n=1 Tax=Hohenbuehelia grisea TaxID=104357 RepID=A0ABR3IXZ8_9AGAR